MIFTMISIEAMWWAIRVIEEWFTTTEGRYWWDLYGIGFVILVIHILDGVWAYIGHIITIRIGCQVMV